MNVPDCPGHRLPCKRLTAGEHSKNAGRDFFKCAQSPACEFFQWADGAGGKGRGGGRGGGGKGRGGGRGGVADGTIVLNAVTLSIGQRKQDGSPCLLIEFPYDDVIIEVMRSIQGAHYDGDIKAWRAPLEAHDTIVDRLTPPSAQRKIGAIHEVPSEVHAALTAPPNAAPVALALPRSIDEALMPHQRAGVEFAVRNGLRALIADEMGLGKTLTALAVVAHARAWPALILCPSSVKYAWRAELQRWLPDTFPDGRGVKVVDAGKETLDRNASALVLTYEGLRRRCEAGEAGALGGYAAVLADESHSIKSGDAGRTKVVLPLLRRARVALLLSGTPSLSRPHELYTQANVVAPRTFASEEAFGQRYCGGSRSRLRLHRLSLPPPPPRPPPSPRPPSAPHPPPRLHPGTRWASGRVPRASRSSTCCCSASSWCAAPRRTSPPRCRPRCTALRASRCPPPRTRSCRRRWRASSACAR